MAPSPRKTTPRPMPDRDILNIDGAAEFLGVSVKTFAKVLREGDVPGRKVGREWKFSRQALIEWVGSSRTSAFLDGSDEEPAADVPPAPRRRGRPPGRAAGAPDAATPRRARPRPLRTDDFSVDDL